MSDTTFTQAGMINDILQESTRLRFVLIDKYGIDLGLITSIRVDGDNFKLDLEVGGQVFRFKAKGLDSVLMNDPDTMNMTMVFDPALAQGVYEICSSFSG